MGDRANLLAVLWDSVKTKDLPAPESQRVRMNANSDNVLRHIIEPYVSDGAFECLLGAAAFRRELYD